MKVFKLPTEGERLAMIDRPNRNNIASVAKYGGMTVRQEKGDVSEIEPSMDVALEDCETNQEMLCTGSSR